MPSEGPGRLMKTENRDNCWLITQWAKEQKIITPLLEWQEWKEINYIAEKNKKLTVKKRNDIEYKKAKCFTMGFVAVHFDQFLANLVRVWFGQCELY